MHELHYFDSVFLIKALIKKKLKGPFKKYWNDTLQKSSKISLPVHVLWSGMSANPCLQLHS